MPITSAPLTATPQPAAQGAQNPLTVQAIQTPNVNPANLSMTPTGVTDLLANNGPQSLTSLLMPLYSQLFGTQSGALAQQRDLTAQSGVASAQSNAQKRGLTGSSIESGAMQGAQASADQGYMQAYSSLLGQYVNEYGAAAGQDVGNQQNYYSNLAQALGQGYADSVQQSEFQRQLDQGMNIAQGNQRAQMYAGAFSGAGSALSAFSDTRLKKNIKKVGRRFGLNVYTFEYDDARAPHLKLPRGTFVGFLAHHVADLYPEAVTVMKGYLAINHVKLAELALA